MKTKELIRLLQEADPTGEEEVTVGNTDIHFVDASEAYYDGCQQILIKDESRKGSYNVIGGKVRAEGIKVCIHTHSITDAIFNNPKLPIEYDSHYAKNHYKKYHDKMRKFSRDVDYKIGLESFIQFVTNRIPAIEKEKIVKVATEFYDRNLKSRARYDENVANYEIIRPDGGKSYPSWHDREQTHWNQNIIVYLSPIDNQIVIENLGDNQ